LVSPCRQPPGASKPIGKPGGLTSGQNRPMRGEAGEAAPPLPNTQNPQTKQAASSTILAEV